MSTGKALSALHDDIWVPAATQLQVHLTIWETAIEEIWPRPEAETTQRDKIYSFMYWDRAIHYQLYICRQCLPANNKLDRIGENSI